MANMNIPNLAGLIVLVLTFLAFLSPLNTAINLMLPKLGETGSFIARMIPVMLLLAIVASAFDSEDQETLR